MPSPFRKLGRKVKSFFRSRSRDGQQASTVHPDADYPTGVEAATTSNSACASTPADIFAPAPALSVHGLDHPITHASGGSNGEQALGKTFSSGVSSTSSREPPPTANLDQAQVFGGNAGTPTKLLIPSSPHSSADPTTSFQPSLLRWQDQDPSSTSPATVVGTSYFPNAHGFHVQSQHFTTNMRSSKTLFEHLNPHISHGAAHDSNERCDAPACYEETRVAIREDIVSWIKHGDGEDAPKQIMWLSGPAGAGKSAIAGSVAETCKEEGLLAASFFFSSFAGSADRCSKQGLIATLAYHISQHNTLHLFETHLLTAIRRHPDIFHKKLKEQSECLILGPFRLMHDQGDRVDWPKIIIIDGLDEVIAEQVDDPTNQRIPRTSEEDQVEILNVLLTLSQSSAFPFRIFIASRPERNIADFFGTDARDTTIDLFLGSKYDPDADIERFLKSKFASIQRRTGISSPSWPGQPVLDRLVEMSSGQFIVPATIIRWVESGLPQRQLDDVLKLVDVGTKNPFAALDALYRHILKRAPNPDNDPHLVVKWILSIHSAVFQRSGMDATPAKFWRVFLEDDDGELSYRLAPITSLISVPPPDDTSSSITMYHKSLTDFLSSPTRCGDLYVDKMECDSYVANRILTTLKGGPLVLPLSSPKDLVGFLEPFIWLELLLISDSINNSVKFLDLLSEGSKAELSSCDVAWWTTVSLSVLHPNRSSFPCGHNGSIAKSDEKIWGPCARLVRGIYWRIHQVMGCDANIPSSTQDATGQVLGSKCHAVCRHWRTGILAKAKELGWCVHELEEVKLNELQNLDMLDVGQKFKRMHQRDDGSYPTCSICQPVPTHT